MTDCFAPPEGHAERARQRRAGETDRAIRLKRQAPAVDGRANAALVAFLAEALRVPKVTVRLQGGWRSRLKRVEVQRLHGAEAAPPVIGAGWLTLEGRKALSSGTARPAVRERENEGDTNSTVYGVQPRASASFVGILPPRVAKWYETRSESRLALGLPGLVKRVLPRNP
jgi:uncharacterized protein YggU (UPF0235/DUF167 family)